MSTQHDNDEDVLPIDESLDNEFGGEDSDLFLDEEE